jgi:hypothetical protein
MLPHSAKTPSPNSDTPIIILVIIIIITIITETRLELPTQPPLRLNTVVLRSIATTTHQSTTIGVRFSLIAHGPRVRHVPPRKALHVLTSAALGFPGVDIAWRARGVHVEADHGFGVGGGEEVFGGGRAGG